MELKYVCSVCVLWLILCIDNFQNKKTKDYGIEFWYESILSTVNDAIDKINAHRNSLT